MRTSMLDLKVPPDLVAVIVGLLMWVVSTVTPSLAAPTAGRALVAIGLLLAGIGLILAARVAFARAGTTFSPLAPARSRELVTTGVYRISRNPMYLGTLLVLLALAAWWSSPAAMITALAFAAYIDRFQIEPEERALGDRFGWIYRAYTDSVRRWI